MKKLFNFAASMLKEELGVNYPQMNGLVLIMFFVLMASTTTLKAQICQRAGNVEVSITPDIPSGVDKIQVNFENFNAYQVTVYATITLIGTKSSKKTTERVIVVPAKTKKALSFDYHHLGEGEFILPRNCSVVMSVERCIDE